MNLTEAQKADLVDIEENRKRLAVDPHRPTYHFAAPTGWLNDPNGLIQWRGQYHMFYQHNPHAAQWGPPYWGHAVSDDLVHWQDLPIALTPDMSPENAGGCWSGCAVDDNSVPTLVYTGVETDRRGEQTTCLAIGDDELLNWQKYEQNPVSRWPEGLDIIRNAYRDPYVWREDDAWYQVVVTAYDDRGQALLYRSQDLKSWEYLHPLIPQELRDALTDEGSIWECPNFFALGDKHVLIISLAGECLQYPVAFVGEYRDYRFCPESMERVDWGYHCFYAPLTMRDGRDRMLMWGWLQEQRSGESQLSAGWSGIMSPPRILSLENNALKSEPVEELETLRQEHFQVDNLELSKGLHKLDVEGRALELKLTLNLEEANEAGLVLALAQDESEGLYIIYNRDHGSLSADWRSPNREQGTWSKPPYTCPLELENNILNLRVFLDGSVAEVYAQSQCLTCRLYPDENSTHVALHSDGAAFLERLEAWTMKNIWSNSKQS